MALDQFLEAVNSSCENGFLFLEFQYKAHYAFVVEKNWSII